ncbi:hypothetical protein DR95_3683 [Proteus vulgaris]|nr:hypothetical protein DR95_3683 [Proteus vulgaris]
MKKLLLVKVHQEYMLIQGIQKTLEDRKGKTNKFWIGAKEWRVVHTGKGVDPHHRILEQTLPNGQKSIWVCIES